jgi:hypothetical protein
VDRQNKWNDLVIRAILFDQDTQIKEVNNFESIQSLLFDSEKYPGIISLIKSKTLDGLKEFDGEKKNELREYLDIIKFSDQNHNTYVATVYDSDELWQDPQIIDIISWSE